MVGLPMLVATPTDLGRLIRELEGLDEQLLQASLRKKEVKMPRTSKFLDEALDMNKVNLLDAAERKLLVEFLTSIRAKAPVLHMSFSADPPVAFIEKMMAWMRREIHPLALITIGLQPNIGAGCIIRTKNKYFDLSLRQDFAKKRELLRQAIVDKMESPAEPAPAPVQPVHGAAA
jgi:hypothetical protein